MNPKNKYQTNKSKILIFWVTVSLILTWFIKDLNIKNLISNEIQGLQTKLTSFSSPLQLMDDGSVERIKDIKLNDALFGLSNFSKSLNDYVFNNKNNNVLKINLFVKFKNWRKILEDRERAIILDIKNNPRWVPCKISDGVKIVKCKVKLKGDLNDHWAAKTRISLKIKLKKQYIHGLQEFSIQKPRTRQFPYDQTFHKINSMQGRLSSNNQFFSNVSVNGETWGIMNVEPEIDNKFLEKRKKRYGVFQISNQDLWIYDRGWKDFKHDGYFLSDPTISLSQKGNKEKIFNVYNNREIFSFISYFLQKKDGKIFEYHMMIDNLILSLAWGSLHTLENSNARYTWNAYTQKLEPILTDQSHWRPVSRLFSDIKSFKLPFEYQMIFNSQKLDEQTFLKSLKKQKEFFKNNDVIELVNFYRNKYFPNDRIINTSPILENINFMEKNTSKILNLLNLTSSFEEKKLKKSLPSLKKVKKFKYFVKPIHFDNGIVRVFNLLDHEVFISRIKYKKSSYAINISIPGSTSKNLSFIDIPTKFLGFYDNKLSVVAEFLGHNKNHIIKNSLISSKKLFDTEANELSELICNRNNLHKTCKITGTNTIDRTTIFKNKVSIQPGTTLILKKGVDLIFMSSVNFDGNKEAPIKIEGEKAGGILILNNPKSTSILKNVKIKNLSNTNFVLRKHTGALNGYGGKFIIKNLEIKNSLSEDQININEADVDVDGIFIKNAISDAFDCDFCTGRIRNFSFENINGDGLDISKSNLFVYNLRGVKVRDKALSIGEKSIINLNKAFFKSVGTGVAVKDSSQAVLSNIFLNNIIHDGFMTYIKKPFFKGETSLKVNNFYDKEEVKENICIREPNTYLSINNVECKSSKVSVTELYKGRMRK